MFFRRMFQRKDTDDNNRNNDNKSDIVDDETLYYTDPSQYGIKSKKRTHLQQNELQLHRNGVVTSSPRAQRKFGGARKPSSSAATLHCPLDITSGVSFVQLTPLWEHILRTRTLPDSICPQKMFAEFLERLRDPEWQVRQHALRVFVDVLVVMGAKADTFMDPLVGQLVENLGHQAPTVRKGALDCLRVYLAETAMPETVMLQILDIGLNQRITNEPFGGRLTCGVMLSLPALVQSTLHTNKRHFILRNAVDMLVQKMGQVTHQEITLKVLLKIRELIGEQEFVVLLSNSAYHEFDLLCNVYGLQQLPTTSTSSGSQMMQRDGSSTTSARKPYYPSWNLADNGWRISDEEQMLKKIPGDKVILETEIKINDETLTMRILEAKDTDTDGTDSICMEASPRKDASGVDTYLTSLEDEVVCGPLDSPRNSIDSTGVIRLLSDSELEEINSNRSSTTTYVGIVTPSTPTRTPKRVTFGGEIVKMRTPDSDANSSNNNSSINNNNENKSDRSRESFNIRQYEKNAEVPEKFESANNITNPLSLEIHNDNTKPLPRPSTAQTLNLDKAEERASSTPPFTTLSSSPRSREIDKSNSAPTRRRDSTASLSPRSSYKRISISPVDSIISPKVPHKEIEVLHNLQREPSPGRARRASIRSTEETTDDKDALDTRSRGNNHQVSETASTTPPPSSWEDLGIVDEDVLMDLRAGDWRCRSQGIHCLQEALRSSDNLARVQPCLDTLLRVLLSSEHHPDVAEDKRRLLINLISRLPLDNLEDRTLQIMTGLCRQGGAGAHRVCKALMQRLPPAAIVLKLLSDEFLHAKSSRFREHALQMVMYALMTFPSTCFDTTTCVTNATFAALDRKKRVRQAALDVLAVLGQITSARAVLDVVQRIAATRDEGPALLAAVKARLGRKQLPLVAEDGTVQYTVRVPSPSQHLETPMDYGRSGNGESARFGADVDWIIGGVGSVSPTSMKRRAQRHRNSSQQSFSRLADRDTGQCIIGGSNHSEETCSKYNSTRSSREKLLGKESCQQTPGKVDDTQPHNVQYALGSGAPLHFGIASKKCNVDFTNYVNRRMVAKSCSDSSMDGRSSDSTYTSSSGGGSGGGDCAGPAVAAVGCAASKNDGGISGRFTRQQTVNSRFPTMDRMDLNVTYVRAQKPPTYYPGMGAYAHLQQQQYNINTTHPMINYGMSNGKRRQHNMVQQQQQQHQQQQRLCFNSQGNFEQQEIHIDERNNNHKNNNNNYNNNNYNNNISNNNINSSNNKTNNHCNNSNCNGNNNNNSNNCNYCKCNKSNCNINNRNNNSGNIAGNLDETYTIPNNTNGGCCAGSFSNNNKNKRNPNNSNNSNNNSNNIMLQHHNEITNGGSCCAGNSNGRRFINVDKFIKQSNKYSQTNGSTENITSNILETHVTPTTSAESTSYSLKSTASAQSQKSSISAVEAASMDQKEEKEQKEEEQEEEKAERNDQNIRNPPPQKILGTAEATHDEDIDENKCSTPTTTLVASLHIAATDNEVNAESPTRWATTSEQDLQLEDFVDAGTLETIGDMSTLTLEEQPQASAALLHRYTGSPVSLLSRTESIKTQLDGTSPVLSRNQSCKSLVTEDDIEENTSCFATQESEDLAEGVADEANQVEIRQETETLHCGSSKSNASERRQLNAAAKPDQTDAPDESKQSAFGTPQQRTTEHCSSKTPASSRTHSPTIAELKRHNSLGVESFESLYNRTTPKQEDLLDNIETSSSSTSSTLSQQLNPCSEKSEPNIQQAQHTPIKQKSKTAHCLKSNSRRISPVSKRAINMTEAELFPQTLTRFERPREALTKSFDQLDSSNWETNVLGLKALVRLIRYHPETLENHMHMVCIQLTKSIRNLRSQVSRAACQATAEIFTIKTKVLEQECDDVVCSLLHRTADTNRFLRADAGRALESMCDQLAPVKILNILTSKGATHQHALVRTTTAKLLNRLIERLGCEKVYNMPRDQRDKFFVTGANLLLEGSLETRSHAKTLFRLLSNHPNYNSRLLVEVIPLRTYRNVEKVLRNIH